MRRLSSLLLICGLLLSGCQPADPLAAYPWLYQREGQTPVIGKDTLSVIAVGDILLGRGVEQPDQAFAASADWLSAADLTLGNLECALTDAPPPSSATLEHSLPAPVRLYAPTQSAAWLKAAGFDLLGLANNHSLDAGPDGLRQTAETLQEAGLAVAGAGATPEQALAAYTFTQNGVRLAILSVNAIPIPPDNALPEGQSAPDGWDIARWQRDAVLAAVSAASRTLMRSSSPSIGATNTSASPTRRKRAMRNGCSTPVPMWSSGTTRTWCRRQSLLTRPDGRTVLAAYSLGNFVFDQGQEDGTDQGLALRLVFDAARSARRPGVGGCRRRTAQAAPPRIPLSYQYVRRSACQQRGSGHPHPAGWLSLHRADLHGSSSPP